MAYINIEEYVQDPYKYEEDVYTTIWEEELIREMRNYDDDYNYDTTKLEKLPYHVSMRNRKGCKGYWRKWGRWNEKLRTAQLIFRGSVGKNLKDIKIRVQPFLHGRYTWDFFLSREVEVMYEENGYIYPRATGRFYHLKYGNYYWVDEDNILQYVPHRSTKSKKPLTWQEHYKYKQNRKKNKWSKTDGLIQLTMINKPELFKFYNDLSTRVKNIKSTILQYKRDIETNPLISDWHYYSKSYKVGRIIDLEKELTPLREQLNELEKGNFDVFFKSNVYLYSQQKECHHFTQP